MADQPNILKMLLANNAYFWDPKEQYTVPRLINLLVDPKEREPTNHQHLHSWVYHHTFRMLHEFDASTKQEAAPIPMGSPVDFVPGPAAE